MLKVNAGLERRLPRTHGERRRWEHKNLQGLDFPGAWDDDEAHRAFRAQVHEDNPGWTVTGYCRINNAEGLAPPA